MRDDLLTHGTVAVPGRGASARPGRVLIVALVTAVISACMCTAAILTPAPAAVAPLIVLVAIGSPLFAAWDAPLALAHVRARRSGTRALAALRRHLAELPETEHPLGL